MGRRSRKGRRESYNTSDASEAVDADFDNHFGGFRKYEIKRRI